MLIAKRFCSVFFFGGGVLVVVASLSRTPPKVCCSQGGQPPVMTVLMWQRGRASQHTLFVVLLNDPKASGVVPHTCFGICALCVVVGLLLLLQLLPAPMMTGSVCHENVCFVLWAKLVGGSPSPSPLPIRQLPTLSPHSPHCVQVLATLAPMAWILSTPWGDGSETKGQKGSVQRARTEGHPRVHSVRTKGTSKAPAQKRFSFG